jgi:serine/threonine-protein kinase
VTKPNSSRSAIDIGTIIDDKYRIEALIGRGGMGSVFLASHARLPGKKVAIKVLHTGAEDADVVARFRREAEIAARLDHPNIVSVDDINVTDDGQPYLVLEYLQGMTLADRIAAGPLPIDQAMSIIRQVGSALSAAHREGIVHRDLKPQNVFLVQTDLGGQTVEVAKVLDFGISKIRGSQTVKTQETALLGTPQYMSPEQATGHHDSVDQRTDIFAMGAIVHEMLSGTPAFTGASIPEVVFKVVYEPAAPLPESIPAEISGAVKKAISKALPERFPSMSSFVEALTGMPLVSPRDMVPPNPPSEFAAGSKHTYNNAGAGLASTLASGDHGGSVVKPISQTSAAGGAGMASTALGVAAPTPAAPPVGVNVATVATMVPNAQQSLHGVAAEARANKVATDSRSIWTKVLLAAPVAVVAVIAIVMFTGHKSQSAYSTNTAAAPVRVGPSSGIAAGSANTAPPPVALADQPKSAVALAESGSDAPADTKPGATAATADPTTSATTKPDATKPDVAKPDTKRPTDKPIEKKTTLKPPTKPSMSADDDAEADEQTPLASAKRAEQAGNLQEAEKLATQVINARETPPRALVNAHFMRGRLRCKLQKTEDAQLDLNWLQSNNHPKQFERLSALCSQ